MLIIYLVLVIVSVFFYILYEPDFSFYLLVFLSAVPIILFIIGKYMSKRIKVEFVTVHSSAGKSSKIPLVLKVTNETKLPVANLIIELEYKNSLDGNKNIVKVNTPVFPEETQYLTMHISAMHYGNIFVRIKRCRVVDMLKLFKFKLKYQKYKDIHSECSFTIVPDHIPIDNPINNYSEMGLETDEFSKTSKGDDPSEIFDIHEYVDGDKINRIHWKLSAKQDKTMVKDYSLPIANSIILMIDLFMPESKKMSFKKYDTIIESAVAVSCYLSENNTPHKVMWYDSDHSELVSMNIVDDDTHRLFVSMLLKASICKEKNLPLLSYIDKTERYKCGHLMYFSTDYNENISMIMKENDLAFKYSYMLITDTNIDDGYDEFAQIVPIKENMIAQSLEDICF